MPFPWVSRARFDDAQQQIAELKAANAKLLELALLKSVPAAAPDEEKEPAPQRPHRKLGAQLRAEFREAAELRAAAANIDKGAR